MITLASCQETILVRAQVPYLILEGTKLYMALIERWPLFEWLFCTQSVYIRPDPLSVQNNETHA